jgi:hypothetical protein
MRKIIFNSIDEFAGVTGHGPTPSVKAIPSWFKKLPKYIGGEAIFDGEGNANLTIKACPPFLDSMMSGYMLYTESDIMVTQKEEGPWLEWRGARGMISTHGKSQIDKKQVPEGYSDQPLKFTNLWQIVTPRGYSTMFTHPENRSDLPFITLSGVVETDEYKSGINFPFMIRENFEGIIPAGTPIVQLHPFKRESWAMELGKSDPKKIRISDMVLNHKITGGYKSLWWKRKEYR